MSALICYPSSFQESSRVLDVGFTVSSFYVSRFESSPESFRIQLYSVWFWTRLFCVCLGLNKSVESHEVMVTVSETDKRSDT